MKRISGKRDVDRALVSAAKQVKASVREINEHAADELKRGNYAGAEALMKLGRAVTAFRADIEALRKKWQTVVGRGTPGHTRRHRSERAALWEYYQPILQALVELGGEARRADLEDQLQKTFVPKLKPGDLDLLSGDRPRWKIMVRRARKAMREEGFIGDGVSTFWKITSAGRRAAKSGKKKQAD